MKAFHKLAIIVPVVVVIAMYFSGYGWLVQEDRVPPQLAGKGGGTCRYQTLRGIRIAYYLGDCPKFSTTRFPDKKERF
jgi:hypothetical protein